MMNSPKQALQKVLTTLLTIGAIVLVVSIVAEADDGTIVGSIITGTMLALLINCILAGYFYEVANEKGFFEKRYFWVPFLFGIMGYVLVAALPTKATNSSTGIKRNGNYAELAKYKELLDAGVLTQEEYDAMKQQILSK